MQLKLKNSFQLLTYVFLVSDFAYCMYSTACNNTPNFLLIKHRNNISDEI